MNIKGLTPHTVTIEPRLRTEGKDNVRMQNSADRDANGRREQGEPELKRHLSQIEFDEAIEILKAHPGVVAAGLMVRVEVHEDCRVIFVEDGAGKVIRRLSEADLWLVTREKDRPTGRILDKAG